MADIQAGTRTDASSSTLLVGVKPRAPADFEGSFIFQASPDGIFNDAVDGIRGLGNRGGAGVVGFGGNEDRSDKEAGGPGVVGHGGNPAFGRIGGNGVVGIGGHGNERVGGVGVVGIGGESSGRYASHGHGVGVVGTGNLADGVIGLSSAAGKSGVYGFNFDDGVAFGVFGAIESRTGAGVAGRNDSGVAVSGFSARRTGVHGRGRIGVYGEGDTGIVGNSESGTGVVGASVQGRAGLFWGDVTIVGTLTVIAGAKSAALRARDDSLRRLYSMESPQSWLEDFGEAKLASGHARVPIADDFVDFVRTDEYHVFVTPLGECAGLFVASRTARDFEVRELNAGASNAAFSYRIVAKRKDIDGRRLEEVAPIERLQDDSTRAPDVPDRHDDATRWARVATSSAQGPAAQKP